MLIDLVAGRFEERELAVRPGSLQGRVDHELVCTAHCRDPDITRTSVAQQEIDKLPRGPCDAFSPARLLQLLQNPPPR